jgi:hypothetical protein
MIIMNDNDYLKNTRNLLTFIYYVRLGKGASRDFGTLVLEVEEGRQL